MNIKTNDSNLLNMVSLNESKIEKVSKIPLNDDLLAVVLKTKAKQFQFDCGLIMAGINVPLTSRFGLQWHYNNMVDFKSFVDSIKSYLYITDSKLTVNDITKLEKQYNKYSKKVQKN